MNIYVGNVPYAATEEDLRKLFGRYGSVVKVTIIYDRYDGRSKGFGFVEMENQEDGERAIKALNGQEMLDHHLKVESRPEFHNPYTFASSPPRPQNNEFAGDFDPLKCNPALNHAVLHPDLWTGYIPIKLTTITPLVLIDAGEKERSPDEHHTYDVCDRLPESSLRGMLRCAYEVVTNSRYGCFGKDNNNNLSYRVGRQKQVYPESPADLLHTSLKPAENMKQLSAADRLFGWTPQSQGKDGGYKSRIRVVCEDDNRPDIVQRFDGGSLPLTILGKPQPTYVYFYVGKNNQGEPHKNGISKQNAGYNKNNYLRGRKQYWHHKGLEAELDEDKQKDCYWKPSVEDRTQVKRENRYQEYRRPDKVPENSKSDWQQKDELNRSIQGWVKPGTVFEATLHVQNLQCVEVGALLWLMTLNDNIDVGDEKHHFRLGYGKPLGFGSVTIEIDKDRCPGGKMPMGTGQHWKGYYKDFYASSTPTELERSQWNMYIQEFKKKMEKAYPKNAQNFDNLTFIDGFLQVLRGPKTDAPIHYPRLKGKPDPAGNNLDWFKDNDKELKLALPRVTDEKGLPYKPTK